MKKYLIAGALALICNGFMTSCSEDLGDYSSLEEAKKAQFAQNFEKFYGTPAANQDWGFGDATLSATRARTRSVNVNGNLWYQNWERPVNVTTDEAAKVLAEFSKKRENSTNTITINWNNYWVHQVHQSNNSYLNGYGQSTGDIHAHMNKIIAYNTSSSNYYYEHVNNFNNGTNTTVYTDDETKQQYIGTTLMLDMGTNASNNNQFGYHNTEDSKDHFEYFIIAGADIDASLAGYYYVGFDYCATPPAGQEANKNMLVNRDWIYNDWIVRISPATASGSGSTTGGSIGSSTSGTEVFYRQHVLVHNWVFCEDLGSSSNNRDFDYNDLVFDARIVDEYQVKRTRYSDGTFSDEITDAPHSYYAKITPLAAGGELAMWFQDSNVSVHSLFGSGVANNVLVNTCKTGQDISLSHMEGLSGKTFIYKFDSEEDANINNITIFVRFSSSTYDLSAKQGQPPHKICVPPATRWAYERTPIDEAYPGFTEYVTQRIDPWDDGVDANLYPLDGVPDSLKIDQLGQYIDVATATTFETSYNVTLAEQETEIWSGENDFANWEGSNAAEIAASQFSEVGDGTVIRFYGIADGDFNIKAIYLDNWSDIDLGDSRWVTQNGDKYEKCNYHNTALNNYIELKLNATTAANFKSKGMRVYGKNFKLLCVSYDNINKKASHVTATPSANEIKVSGNNAVNWKLENNNSFSIEGSAFVSAAVGKKSVLRIYGEPWTDNDSWSTDVKTHTWSFAGTGFSFATNNKIASTDSNGADLAGKGYLEYELTGGDANELKINGLRFQGHGFSIYYITIDNTDKEEETISGTQIWPDSGNGSATGDLSFDGSKFNGATANKQIHIYATFGPNNWWNCSFNFNDWASAQDIISVSGWTTDGQSIKATNAAVVETGFILPLNDMLISWMKSKGITFHFGNLTVTNITIEDR